MNINSDVKTVQASDSNVFSFLTDFNNFQKLMPEQIINWQSDTDSCSFTIKGMAEIRMKISEKLPYSKIVIASEANLPLSFSLKWNISPNGNSMSDVQLVFEGNVNPMVSMMVKSPLQNFVNVLVEKLKEYFED
jgi:carbon monoxide dehydrogenase subunit G